MLSLQSKTLRFSVLAALFVVSLAATMFAIHKWRGRRSPAPNTHEGSLENIPGLAVGDTVKLPTLPTLENKATDLSAREQTYLLLAFFSTKCEGCSLDQPFWKDLRKEIAGQSVAFFIVAIDVDQAAIQRYASSYDFADLPVLFDPQKSALAGFRIQFVPQYVLFSTDGKVIHRWTGIRRYEPGRGTAVDKLPGFREFYSAQ